MITPAHISAFLEAAASAGQDLDALLVHQDGRRVFEHYWWPHSRETLHSLHSATKSFTGIAVGFAVDAGALSLDDRVLDFFPDEAPASPSENLSLMTVRDLLTMRTGHRVTPSGAKWRLLTTSWTRAFLAEEVGRRPGEEFSYSSASSHMLSAIVSRVVGESIAEYLRPRLFEPLGIDHYVWESDPEGYSSGGNGLSLRADDFAKWGILHRDGGRWDGRQVVPQWWVEESTRPQVAPIARLVFDGVDYRPGTVSDDIRLGYGYQVWRGRQDSFYASGLFGQLCIVVPDRELVVVLNAATSGNLLQTAYEVLLAPEPVPRAAGDAFADIQARLRSTSAAPVLPSQSRPLTARRYACPPNDEGIDFVTVEQIGGDVVLTIEDQRGRHQVIAGLGSWRSGRSSMTTTLLHHSYQEESARVQAGARWMDPATLVIDVWFVETPFHDTVRLSFGDDDQTVTWRHTVNVNSGPTELAPVAAVAG